MVAPVCPMTLRAMSNTDPFPIIEAIRSQGSPVWDDEMKGWLVASYDLCKYVEANEQLFRHPYADAAELVYEIKGGRRNVTAMQGSDHTRMHHYMTMLFSPKNIDLYSRVAITPILEYLLDRLEGKQRVQPHRSDCDRTAAAGSDILARDGLARRFHVEARAASA